jgi:DNA-directed RNA polymerase alpha subunit
MIKQIEGRRRFVKGNESQVILGVDGITGSTPLTRARCIQMQIDFHNERIMELEKELKSVGQACSEEMTRELWLETSLAEIFGDIELRFVNRMEEAGVLYLKDLLKLTRGQLMSLSNVGEKTIANVFKRLEEIGFSAKSSKPR